MRTHSSLPSSQPVEETVQERLLRDTLHERANLSIEIDSVWVQVAQRLPELHRQAKPASQFRFPFWLSGKQPRKVRMRGLPMVATLALIAVLLMGAGIATGVTSSWGTVWHDLLSVLRPQVPASQFQEIGQQQQSNGVKITLESVYASTDRTIIGLMIQLSPDLLNDHWGALPQSFDFVVNGRKEMLSGLQQAQCLMNFGKNHSEYCIWELAPLHVSASAENLNVTWDFTSITLKELLPPNTYEAHSGHWSFHFTVPFHRQNHDPGLPPTPAS